MSIMGDNDGVPSAVSCGYLKCVEMDSKVPPIRADYLKGSGPMRALHSVIHCLTCSQSVGCQ